MTFRVEADGRHVSAVDRDGLSLWVRNPFVDVDMCPYRTAHPFVAEIGPLLVFELRPQSDADLNAKLVRDLNTTLTEFGCKPWSACARPRLGDRFVTLTFNSSQSGELNIRTGDFYLSSQN